MLFLIHAAKLHIFLDICKDLGRKIFFARNFDGFQDGLLCCFVCFLIPWILIPVSERRCYACLMVVFRICCVNPVLATVVLKAPCIFRADLTLTLCWPCAPPALLLHPSHSFPRKTKGSTWHIYQAPPIALRITIFLLYTAILISAKPRTIISCEIFAMGVGKIEPII